MRYCGECGTQLRDDDLFCGECGARQEAVVFPEIVSVDPKVERNHEENINVTIVDEARETGLKLGKIPGWVVVLTLIVCSPLILAFLTVDLLLVLPEAIWWVIYFGLQIVALAMMCCKKSWNLWIKVIVVALYVLSNII